MTQFSTSSRIVRQPTRSTREAAVTMPELPDSPSEENLLVEYYRTIVRHRRIILLCAVSGLVIATLFHLTTQPVYRTRSSLDIQTVNGDFMNMRSIDPTAASSTSEANVQTQVKLLQSDSLLDRVESILRTQPHPSSVPRNDLLSHLRRILHVGSTPTIPFETLLDQTAQGLKVKPLGITRLVEVTCDSWNAAFSAKFCNTLTSEYQAQDLENRGSTAKHTSDWLMHQAADIRLKAEESQKRLFAATGGNGLILSQESNTVGEDRLRQMQGELVKAQADRMEKEAQSVVAHTSAAESTPSIADNPAYAAARAKLAELQTQVAALVPPLTEANPKVIHLRAQIKQVQSSMVLQGSASGERLQNEFAAAKHREELLALAYRSQESSVSSDLEKGSQVALLRREVDSEQQLYQTLLQRAKEAGFASAMQASTIRVVDAAQQPKFAFYPQRILAAGVGGLLGALLGIALAFFKDRSAAVVRNPGEIGRLLHIEELGVIPSPATDAKWGKLLTRPAVKLGTGESSAGRDDHSALENARWDDRFSLVAEAYRNTTLSIMLSGQRAPTRAYVVTSPNSGEGKTTVTTNLGVALSRSKLRVVIVDGDLRMPSLHKAMSVSNDLGLRDLLRGDTSFAPALCQATAFPNLSVLPSGKGSEDVVQLLHSAHMSEVLRDLAQEFEVVLIDTPPMLHMADARIFSGHADGVILILRSGITTLEQAAAARDVLDHDRVPIIGSILNDFNPAKDGQGAYYKSYYAYQQPGSGLAVRR